jgi:hypothetical protein
MFGCTGFELMHGQQEKSSRWQSIRDDDDDDGHGYNAVQAEVYQCLNMEALDSKAVIRR